MENEEKMTLKEAAEYLGLEEFWVEELLYVGTIKSLSKEDVEEYFSEAPTEIIEKEEKCSSRK